MVELMAFQILLFQSTLPRRERRINTVQFVDYDDFNPRSREGSDLFSRAALFLCYHFNPRSREGSDICAPGS